VLACGDREMCRRSQYSRTAGSRLSRQLHGVAVVAAILSALADSGCSYQLASLGSKDDGDPMPTGSIAQRVGYTVRDANSSGPAEVDLAYARAAASNAVAGGAKDTSVPWQNPQTGAGGNITPLDTSYREDGLPCRDFLASYVHGAAQDWLQGAACRTSNGAWEVMRLTPLKPS
jgi:surface antigen